VRFDRNNAYKEEVEELEFVLLRAHIDQLAIYSKRLEMWMEMSSLSEVKEVGGEFLLRG